jgi:large subunit ribosomal protein L2
MELIKKKAVTNGTRHELNIKKNLLTKKNNIIKTLSQGYKNTSGRSKYTGHITVRHKGGGNKINYRIINFRSQEYISLIISTFYDPNRSSFISLNYDLVNKNFFNTIAVNSIFPGCLILCNSTKTDLYLGYRMSLKSIPPGSLVNNISSNSLNISKYVRSAGTFGQIIQKNLLVCKIKLPSNQIIEVSVDSYATIGVVSNLKHNLIVLGKAGKNRYKGIRPSVRGIAMNPVDHPHGGRSNGGKPCVTPWGIPTKGKPTVKKKAYE